MTEKEVLAKLEVFKNAIIKIKGENKELAENLDKVSSDKKLLEESLAKKDNEITSLNSLMNDRMASSANKEDIEKVIEEISKFNNTTSEKPDYVDDFNKIKESFNEENARLRKELEDKNREISELKLSKDKEIENIRKEHESSLKTLQNLYESELTNVKNVTDNILAENKGLKENNLSVDRINESLKSAIATKTELEEKNKELSEKVKRLEEIINSSKAEIKEVKVVKRELPPTPVPSVNSNIATVKEEDTAKEATHTIRNQSSIDKETLPYRFGRTSKTIMEKVDLFLDALYDGTRKDSSGITLLSDTKAAKELVGLSDREYEVFMDRLSSLDYNATPLIWEQDGRYHTNFDKSWVKTYISRII